MKAAYQAAKQASSKNLVKQLTGDQSPIKDEIATERALGTAEFARDLFSRDGKYHNEDPALLNSSRAFRAREYLKDLLSSSQGKAKLYKDILAKGYENFWVTGFCLNQINTNLESLSKVEKAQILESVIQALDLDLKRYSSRDKRQKFL